MRTLLLVTALIWQQPCVVAQTKFALDQVRAAGSVAPMRLMGIDAGGDLIEMVIGPGITVNGNVVSAVSTAVAIPSAKLVPQVLTRGADGLYTPAPGSGLFYRNGQLLIPGTGYKLDAVSGKVGPVNGAVWTAADEIVQVLVMVTGVPPFISPAQ